MGLIGQIVLQGGSLKLITLQFRTYYSSMWDSNLNHEVKSYALYQLSEVLGVGFEPTKRKANDLKSIPFDQARET